MEPGWAVATAAAAVCLAVIVVIVVVRVARRRDAQAGLKLPEVVVALLALGATVYFGVKAQEPTGKALPPAPQPTNVVATGTSNPSARPTASPRAVTLTYDVVRIVDLKNRPGVVDATVRVAGPPSPGTQYLLVVRHNGGLQLKGKVNSSDGDHTIEADLRLADPGSWRDFFVVGADAVAVEAWETSVNENPLQAMPAGSRELTDRIPHRMPL